MQLYITGSSNNSNSKAAAASAITVDVAADANTAAGAADASAAAAAEAKLASLTPAFSRSYATFSHALSGLSGLRRSGSNSSSGDIGSGLAGGFFGFRSVWDPVAAVVFLPGYLLVLAAGAVRWAAFGAVKARCARLGGALGLLLAVLVGMLDGALGRCQGGEDGVRMGGGYRTGGLAEPAHNTRTSSSLTWLVTWPPNFNPVVSCSRAFPTGLWLTPTSRVGR